MDSADHPDPRADRYARQERFAGIGPSGQARLRAARVAIIGCGALGTCSAEYLARAGIGSIVLIDRDLIEWSNLQRQIAFTEDDARRARPKALALAERLRQVRGDLEIDVRPVELEPSNAASLTAGADILVDGTDNVPTRLLLNDLALSRSIPWVYAGAIEGSAWCALFAAGGRPCLRCLLDEPPPPGALPTCDVAGVLGPVVGVAASWQATLALRALAGSADDVAGRLVRLSPWQGDARIAPILPDPDCPACVQGRLEWLGGARGAVAALAERLCGRDAVQIRPARAAPGPADLARLAARLRPLGKVELTEHLLRARIEGLTLTVFRDYRAVIDGLTDTTRARSLYDRWVGE